jgi:nicotinamidase-related amidase
MSTALVIIDVQNAILAGEASPARQPANDAALDEMVSRLTGVRNKARAAGIPVILVQHGDGPGSPLETGTKGWQLRTELAPEGDDIVVAKHSCDSFFQTDLQDRLTERHIDRLVICGCQTPYCVDTTARRAISLGYDVTLIADGHMTPDMGDLHFDQIIKHHNTVLNGFGADGHSITLINARDIRF